MSTTILTIESLQELSSAEAVVQLFQSLGYQTLSNFTLPVNQLFPRPEVQVQVKRVWGIAQYQPLLYVYLLEVDTLNNTLVKQLCRVIARRQGNYLLVFTKDYSELAFVNLVRSTSQESGRSIELRRLDIDRANPTPKAVRILRRIAVADAQMPTPLLAVKLYKKQCEAFELTKWRHDEFNNRSLFSDYYLKERLPDDPNQYPEWRQDITSVYQKARKLYQSLDFDALQRNESATQEKWVRPILHLLGHSNIEQSKDDAHPTFHLFSDVDYDSERVSPVLCHVKAWGHYLDHYGQQEPQELEQPLNPSFQIIRFLSEYRADWGILTNGREWRLYYTKAHATASNYYEIDLAELLESNDVESFRYFYHFFCQQSFLSEAERKSFLERVYDGSQDYAIKLAERIKDNVFERIFPSLAEGFVAYRKQENKVTQETDDSLKLIFASSLTLLYRLLFLLYAEDRDLLPVGEQYGYKWYSLKALKEDVAKALEDGNQTYSRTTYRLWDELESLFDVIAKGDRDLNVPTYNGGLFSGDNPRNAFLAEHKIADYWLATALDLLTRDVDPDIGRKGFIDYKSLGVNQLGSIYEGLLEFHLRIADEELTVIRQKGKEIYKPIGELPNRAKILRTVSEGEIYLENDKRERKATGSYYTPDYIVKYIVENTVGPVLEENFSKVEELFATKMGANAAEHPAVTELFSLKVLDPAMGSGHFLVKAVDFITERMIAFLAKHPANPILGELRRIRTTIRDELESQGVMIDDSQLTGENLLKRRVMKSCIYGVDLNDMAVELSKLSLWLDAFTLGAPLSFLDHHLKCGNSLIGATDIKDYIHPEVRPYKDFLKAVGELVRVSQLTDATMTEVDESSKLYAQASARLFPTIERANVEVAKYFMDISKPGVAHAASWAYKDRIATDSHSRLSLNNFNTAQQVAQDKHFFHWRLEFPEVFYTPAGERRNPGFDAVVGNPPYVSFGLRGVGTLDDTEVNYYRNAYADSAEYKISVYALFMQRAIQVTNQGGYHGFIVPDSFLIGQYFSKIRNYILRQCDIKDINLILEDFWPEGSVGRSVIYIFKRPIVVPATDDMQVAMFETLQDFKNENGFVNHYSQTFFDRVHLKRFRLLFTPEEKSLVERVETSARLRLGDVMSVHTGVRSRIGQANIQSREKRGPTWHKGLVSSAQVIRYGVFWEGHYLNIDPKLLWSGGWDKNVIFQEKILIRQTGDRIIAGLDQYQLYHLNNTHSAVLHNHDYDIRYLLTLLNSSLLLRYYTLTTLELGRSMAQTDIETLLQLPIRSIEFTTPASERKRLGEKGQRLYGICMEKGEQDCVLGFVEHQLVQRPERADVAHDLLAYLAQQMIKMNKQKQAEVSRCLEWLEDAIDAEINDLTGKTKLRAYYDYSWDDILKVLIKNKSKLSINPTLPLMQNMLEDEYRKSMNVLERLMKRITATDELIDRIVYRLYGLTTDN